MANFMNVKLFGEDNDIPCNPTRTNTVVKTKYNGWKLADNATLDDWEMCIVFPTEEKANFFKKSFKHDMPNYRDGMMKDEDHVVHIIHFKYPKPDRLYADQIYVRKETD